MNKDHSVAFEIASKHWILDSFVYYECNSISSKGFLPTDNTYVNLNGNRSYEKGAEDMADWF